MKVKREVNKPKYGVAKQAQWSNKQRMEVVRAYLVLGNVMLVVAATGVPEDTIRKWKMSQWWKDAIDELRRSQKLELSGKLKKVIDKTVLLLEDRVNNGDFVFDKTTGDYTKRKPVNAYTANLIAGNLMDKDLILEREATTEKDTDEGLELRLKKLKEEMIKFAKMKVIDGEIITNEPVQLPHSVL